MSEKIEIVATGLVIRPGDTLIVCIPKDITNEQAEHLRAQVKEKLPDVADVVLAVGVSAVAALRPGDE